MIKARSDGSGCSRRRRKKTQKKTRRNKATASLLELGGVFTLEEEQRTKPKAFLRGRDVFTFLLTGFDKSLVQNWCIAAGHE